MTIEEVKAQLQTLYNRYDQRMNRGQFDLAEATLDQIDYLKGKYHL